VSSPTPPGDCQLVVVFDEISQLMPTVSKSIDVNLNNLRKKGGSRILVLRWAMMTLQKGSRWLSCWDSLWLM
jgi:hypothetical protein